MKNKRRELPGREGPGAPLRKRAKKLPLGTLAAGLLTSSLCMFLFLRGLETEVLPVTGALPGTEAKIRCIVTDYPLRTNHKFLYYVKVERVSVGGELRELPAFTARISTWTPFDCEPWDTLECTVEFFGFDGGGLYSSQNSYLSHGVILGGYLSEYEDVRVIPGVESPPAKYAVELRRLLGRGFEQHLPSDEAGLIRAVLLGERELISDRDYGNFKKLGVTHLLVISGLHMAVLAAFLSKGLGKLFRKRAVRNLLIGLFIAGFLILIGGPFSALRSGIMYLIYLAADSLGEQADGLNSLGAAVLLICLWNPFAAGDLGFALSVTATLGILLLGEPISKGLQKPFESRPRLQKALAPAADSLGMSFGALLFTLPIQTLVFQGISLWAPVATLLLIFPCTLLLQASVGAAFLHLLPWLEPAADPFFFCAGCLARLSEGIAGLLAKLPPAFLDLSEPVWPAVLTVTAVLGILVFRAGGSRAVTRAAVLLAALVLLGKGAGDFCRRDVVVLAAAPDSSCVAVIRGHKAVVLALDGYRTDAAAELLQRKNVWKVEAVCLPGEGREAREAAVKVLDSFGADRLVLPQNAYVGKDLLLAGRQAERVYLEPGTSLELLGGVEFTLSPEGTSFSVGANGSTAAVGNGGPGRCDVLFFPGEESKMISAFTVLQKDDIIAAERLLYKSTCPPGLFPSETTGDGTLYQRAVRAYDIIAAERLSRRTPEPRSGSLLLRKSTGLLQSVDAFCAYDIIAAESTETAPAGLPAGRYALPAGNGLYVDLYPGGAIGFGGESECLK